MDQEIAALSIGASWLLVIGLAFAGLLRVIVRRRKPAPDHVENYWRQGE